jgi:hypothetical protein
VVKVELAYSDDCCGDGFVSVQGESSVEDFKCCSGGAGKFVRKEVADVVECAGTGHAEVFESGAASVLKEDDSGALNVDCHRVTSSNRTMSPAVSRLGEPVRSVSNRTRSVEPRRFHPPGITPG